MAKTRRDGDCLVFMGKRSPKGYGRTHEMVDGRVLERWVHRVVYEHHRGPIPDGLFVLHSCDKPPCVEIAHLRVGTKKENAADMVERARGRRPDSKPVCPRGHDLTLPGAVRARPTRSRNPAKARGWKCVQCQREDGRANRERAGFAYTGQPLNRDKTHCKRGHEFTPENTYAMPRGGRECRTCALGYGRAFAAARRDHADLGPEIGESAIRERLARRLGLSGDDVLKVGRVADLFAVSAGAVRRWGADGLLPALRTTDGHRRYRVADVVRQSPTYAAASGALAGATPWLERRRAWRRVGTCAQDRPIE